MIRIATILFAFLAAFSRAAEDAPWIKAIDLRSMTPTEADEGREYRIRGTFIFHDDLNAVFLQDETAGALFWHRGETGFTPGDIIEVQGITKAGLYVPGLEKTTFRIIGHGPTPEPVEATYDDLISGRYHYQWVSVEGIVRSIRADDKGKQHIRLALGSRIVEVHVKDLPEGVPLIDHRVRVTGLAAGGINDRHQLIRPYVWPRDATGITVVASPVPPAELPAVSTEKLLTFAPSGRTGHRVKMKGTVLGSFSNGRLFIRENKSALAVKLDEPDFPQPGTEIEVLGFPEMEGFSATLSDAAIIGRSTGRTPLPISTDIPGILTGNLNHELVSFTGTVVDSFRSENGSSISLQTNGSSIHVLSPDPSFLPPADTRLLITGICDVETSRSVNYMSHPETISILVRQPADLSIIQSPPWWNTGRLTAALFALGGLCALTILWIILLRRQVEKQTGALRDRIENEAMMLERQRIAREFHDTLEQDLTGLSLQLGAASAKSPTETSRGPLDTARHLVSRIQTETRNLLLDLRTPPEEALDLPGALDALAAKYIDSPGPRVTSHPGPVLPPLPPRTIHHLRMIAAESVTNAIKHARAEAIDIRLISEDGSLVLTITDDGRGFDPDSETREKPGHFGCMGIRERSRKLGAEADWLSKPGQGTTVRISLPLNHA